MAFTQDMSILRKKLWRYLRRAYWSGHFPSLNALLRNRGRLLAYYGFLGDGNFGDELVYEAARSLLRPCLLVPDTLRKPVVTGLLLKAGFLTFRGEVLGGGTLVGPRVELPPEDPSKAKSVFVHGTGARTFFSDGWIDALRSRAVFGGVRGRASQARLAGKGCLLDIDGDAAFHFLSGDDRARRDVGSVLVNFGTHNAESAMTAARSEIRRFVAAMLHRGVAVEFLPFHSVDVELGLELKRDFPAVRRHGIPRDFAAAAAIFENVGFAVGERLHFAVMSLLCGCPCFFGHVRAQAP